MRASIIGSFGNCGECIEFMKGETAHLYRVVALHHPNAPASTAGDIYVVDIGVPATVVNGYRKLGTTRER